MKQQLTDREQLALTFARQHYRWRKRFTETREQHNAKLPCGIKPDVWDSWYDYPTGDAWINEDYRIVRRLLAEGRV
jgi:hypothetical protein